MNELRMYILVNASVKMSAGKMAAQTGHAISAVTERMVSAYQSDWGKYKHGGHPKIVLKAPEEEMIKLLDRYERDERIWCIGIRDAGRTQLPPNTFTALAFRPMYKTELPEELINLKLA